VLYSACVRELFSADLLCAPLQVNIEVSSADMSLLCRLTVKNSAATLADNMTIAGDFEHAETATTCTTATGGAGTEVK
jgi:hypothetical protein